MPTRLAASTLLISLIAATSAHADCKAEVQSIMQGMEASPPYRVEIEMTSAGTTSKMQGEAILPNSIHMTSDQMEMVMTPNGVWMGKPGKMQKSPPEMAEQMKGMIKQGMNMGATGIEATECLGFTDFEGGSFEQFKYKLNTTFMGIATKAAVDLYVDDDKRPVWMVIDGEAMGTKSLTRQHITYDDSVTIADPN
jgi:hypothetical protein